MFSKTSYIKSLQKISRDIDNQIYLNPLNPDEVSKSFTMKSKTVEKDKDFAKIVQKKLSRNKNLHLSYDNK